MSSRNSLEVGHCYVARDGRHVSITGKVASRSPYPYRGTAELNGTISGNNCWTKRGRHLGSLETKHQVGNPLDIVKKCDRCIVQTPLQ